MWILNLHSQQCPSTSAVPSDPAFLLLSFSLPLPQPTSHPFVSQIASHFTMSPTFPSNIIAKPSSSSHPTKKKQQQGLRTPFLVLNGISTTGDNDTSTTTCISASISSDTSSASTDAPTGCLRFFLSHSSSSSKTPSNRLKPSSKTPKSTSNIRPLRPVRSKLLKENLPKCALRENSRPTKPKSTKLETLRKNSPCLYRWQSGKKPSSVGSQKSNILSLATVEKLPSDGEGLEKHEEQSLVRMVDDKCQPSELSLYSSDFNFTPLRKMESATGLDRTVDKVVEENSNTGHSKTPPVQASVSPEIQCDSALMSTVTPVCYGAGYVVSGVSDKRKCRPRGLLIVGENTMQTCTSKVKAIQNFDNEEDEDESIARDTNTTSAILKVPSPIEASMNWLLSPCNEEEDEDQKAKSENVSPQSESLAESIALRSLPSPSSVDALPPDIYSSPEFQGFLEPLSFQDPIPSSPTCAPNCLDVILKEGRRHRYQLNGENSPFSMDSLSSENVVQTPQSDSSSTRKVYPPWLTADSCEKHDQNSVSELFSLANLSRGSPKATMSLTDLSFQFDSLATISNSMDLSQFQKILDDQALWNSNCSSEDLLKSQIRVSWREGLMSRIYEMDEFDSCRCLSDAEETVDSCSISLSDILQTPLEQHNDCGADPIVTNKSGSSGSLVHDETESFEKCIEKLSHQIPCSCAESISTDGGGLVASGDSDWNLCYKNGLFDS